MTKINRKPRSLPGPYSSSLSKFFVITDDISHTSNFCDRLLSEHNAIEKTKTGMKAAPVPLNSHSTVLGRVFDLCGSEVLVISEGSSGYFEDRGNAKDFIETAQNHNAAAVFRQSYVRLIHPDPGRGILHLCVDFLNPDALSSFDSSSNQIMVGSQKDFPFNAALISNIFSAADEANIRLQLANAYLVADQFSETAAHIQIILGQYLNSVKGIGSLQSNPFSMQIPVFGIDGAIETLYADKYRIPYAIIAIPTAIYELEAIPVGIHRTTSIYRPKLTKLSDSEKLESHNEFCDLVVSTILGY